MPLYRGYTDDTFKTRQERPAAEEYVGFLGPVIGAEVGDTIKVVFRNNCSIPASMHPYGVFYDKDSEGAEYSGGDKKDEVAPGGTHSYLWQVPDRAGPGPMDGSSAMWTYHSHADEVSDVVVGLSGFLVATARGFSGVGVPQNVVSSPGCWTLTNIVRCSGVVMTPVISHLRGPVRNRRIFWWRGRRRASCCS